MGVKEEIIDYIRERTEQIDLDNLPEELTAQFLAEKYHLKRNTINYYLNILVEEGTLIKIETRPAYFLHKGTIASRFAPVQKNIFVSLRELQSQLQATANGDRGFDENSSGDLKKEVDTSAFSNLVGYDRSLNRIIHMVKVAVMYPNHSMPIMISGESGVGKSMMARIIYQFCLDNAILAKDAPFLQFNCAQYANNPELMSSKLFGHCKGAFTGAVADSTGVLEAADQGILFLDEAHRLSQEDQEKLFVFLDKGEYTRIGESGKIRKAKVLIIFATTKDPRKSFLETFRRRIPVNINIPSLEERSPEEKRRLIYFFLISECRTFGKSVFLPDGILHVLQHHIFEANAGELQVTIRYMCASANARESNKDIIHLTYWDMPPQLASDELAEPVHQIGAGKGVTISENTEIDSLFDQHRISAQVQSTLANLNEIREGKWPSLTENNIAQAAVDQIGYLVRILIVESKHLNFDKSGGILYKKILNWCSQQGTFWSVESVEGISDFLARYIYLRYYYLKNIENLITDEILKTQEYYRDKFSAEFAFARDFWDEFQRRMQIPPNAIDEIIAGLAAVYYHVRLMPNHVYALILGKTISSAYSIAEYCNSKRNRYIYDYLDMKEKEDVQKVIGHVNEKIRSNEQYKSVILLNEDEFSNEDEYAIEDNLKIETLIISHVSFWEANRISDLIITGNSLNEINRKVSKFESRQNILYHLGKHMTPVFLCSCYTGMATAKKVEKLIEESIPEGAKLQLQACSFEELKREKKHHHAFRGNRVLAVVGTANPEIPGVKFISVEDIISQSGASQLKDILKTVMSEEQCETMLNNLVCNFTVERLVGALSILDTEKTIRNIESSILAFENASGRKLSGKVKTCLYIHVSCMLERLIRNLPGDIVAEDEIFERTHQKEIYLIHRTFANLEEIYSVEIPLYEIRFIYEIIYDEDLNRS